MTELVRCLRDESFDEGRLKLLKKIKKELYCYKPEQVKEILNSFSFDPGIVEAFKIIKPYICNVYEDSKPMLKLCEEIYKLNPSNIEAIIGLGSNCRLCGLDKESVYYFSKAMELDSKYPCLYENWELAYFSATTFWERMNPLTTIFWKRHPILLWLCVATFSYICTKKNL
jgi:hypothetical protein